MTTVYARFVSKYMQSKNYFNLLPILFSVFLSFANSHADVTFTTPLTTNQNLAYCKDYFHEEWGTRLSMTDSSSGALEDIPSLQTKNTTAFSYTNGELSFTSTGPAPLATLLQYSVVGSLAIGSRYGEIRPVDSSVYKLFTVRIYASESTVAQFRWFHAHDRWAITTVAIAEGWHTYQIDLPNATISSSSGTNVGWTQGNAQGLELFPSNENGVNIKIDWAMLTPYEASCPTYAINYNATANGADDLFSMYADTNTSPADGVTDEILNEQVAAGAGTTTLYADKVFPQSYNIYAILSGDWATLNLRDPFDMSNAEDIISSLSYGLSNVSFSGGKLNAQISHSDSSFYLGIRNGKKIDASKYRYLSIGVNYSAKPGDSIAGESLRVIIFKNGNDFDHTGVAVNSGNNDLQIDMSGGNWSGTIDAIRIDPLNASIGATIAVDYVALRKNGYVTSLTTPTIQNAPGTIAVNDIALSLIQPDKKGGADFAQENMANSWNMDEADDLGPLFNLTAAYLYPNSTLFDPAGNRQVGDFFYAVNFPGDGDPTYFSVLNNATIDTSRYVNLCFRGWNKTESPSQYNSVARILWQDPREGNTEASYKNGDDIILTRAANTYCIDMTREIQLEPALPPGSPNPWTSIGESGNLLKFFRIDMNENEEGAAASYYSVLDYISLRKDQEVKTQAAIVVSAALTDTVELYSNTSRATSGGSLIGTLASGRNTNVFKWDTSAVANGSYYIYAKVTKNGNAISRLSEGRIKVNNSFTQDVSTPILSCERPFTNYLFDSEIELAGYALDDVRLATVEVFIDNAYVKSILPSLYHLAARGLYPNYSESNNPGFQEFVSASSLSFGAHDIRLVATDTSGNESVCQYVITRQAGASTAPLTYPASDAVAVDIPVTVVATPTPIPAPSPQLSLSFTKDTFNANISGAERCSRVDLLASSNATFTSPTVVYSKNGIASVSLQAKKLPKFKAAKPGKKGAVKDDGVVYFKASCAAESGQSAVKNLNFNKVKSKKISATEKALLSLIKKNTKVK
jgi:hypothetical protein